MAQAFTANEKTQSAIDFSDLCSDLRAMMEGVSSRISNLANASALLWERISDLNWVGFYTMEGDHLELGPFQGKVACTSIAVGAGVCGTAVLQDREQVVADVHQFSGHIACDGASNSEIVLPIHVNGTIWGVLDIDSPSFGRFGEAERNGLLQVVQVLETMLAQCR